MKNVYNLIKETDNVLDVGGAASTFERANAVIDFLPYEKRRNQLHICKEYFTRKDWFVQDICDFKKPWPFKNKEFDFINASQVFEDVRDPLYCISEMVRVGRKGYVEVPARFWEQVYGLQHEGFCGFDHHRWIIDTVDNKFRLIFKNHMLHGKKEYQIQKIKPWPTLNKNHAILGMFWEGEVKAYEHISVGSNFLVNFFKETVELSKNIKNLHEPETAPLKEIEYPFYNDGKAHITVLKQKTIIKY